MPNPHSQPEGASGRTEAIRQALRSIYSFEGAVSLLAVDSALEDLTALEAEMERLTADLHEKQAECDGLYAEVSAKVSAKDAEIARLTAALAEAKKVMEIALLNLPDEPYVAEAILEANAITSAGRQDG